MTPDPTDPTATELETDQVRVLSGRPAPDEVAALVAALCATTPTAAVHPPKPLWGDPARALPGVTRPMPQGWIRSARP